MPIVGEHTYNNLNFIESIPDGQRLPECPLHEIYETNETLKNLDHEDRYLLT